VSEVIHKIMNWVGYDGRPITTGKMPAARIVCYGVSTLMSPDINHPRFGHDFIRPSGAGFILFVYHQFPLVTGGYWHWPLRGRGNVQMVAV